MTTTNTLTVASPPMASQSGAISIGPLVLSSPTSTAEVLDITFTLPSWVGVIVPAGALWVVIVPPANFAPNYWGLSPYGVGAGNVNLGSGVGVLPVDLASTITGFDLFSNSAGTFELTFF